MIIFRQITEEDIPALFEIRIATWGSDTRQRVIDPGIDNAGWIALLDSKPVGFALASRCKGELWAIAVLPEYQGRGVGRELMRQAEAWLFSYGWHEIWLATHAEEHRGAVSFFHHLGWVDWKMDCERHLKKPNPRSVIALEEHAVADPATGYARLVRLWRGPSDKRHWLCLFLDGEHYWRDMDAVSVLDNLSKQSLIPGMTFAFIGHVSGAARHEDYTCNERYSRFVGEKVIRWLREEVPSVQEHDHLIAGLSLSGLMAAYMTLKYPRQFAYCLSQSGSHWWRHEWFANIARQEAPITARFRLSVGEGETDAGVKHPPTSLLQEISQIAGVEKAVHVLKEIGGTVRYHRYQGSHSLQGWREELIEALPWLLSDDSKSAVGCR